MSIDTPMNSDLHLYEYFIYEQSKRNFYCSITIFLQHSHRMFQVKFYIIYKICADEVFYGYGNVTLFYHFLLRFIYV